MVSIFYLFTVYSVKPDVTVSNNMMGFAVPYTSMYREKIEYKQS